MTAEIICVGTEILLGDIVNTNAAFISQKCAKLGLSMYYQSVVGDNDSRLEQMLLLALERSDIVILSGGLGPTEDDITRNIAAKVTESPLEMDEDVRRQVKKMLEKYCRNHPGVNITENNWRQAEVPRGAIVLENPNGTAPGLIIQKNGKHVILLPGPPGELQPMFNDKVHPYLEKLSGNTIYSKTIKICGIGESMAETQIKDLIDSQTNPTIATYAKIGEVHIRITAKASSVKEAKALIKPVSRELKMRFGKHIFSTDEAKSLEECVVDILRDQKLKLAVAESCTGGMLASRLVGVPGVSDVFKLGYITYSDKAKHRALLVKNSTLARHSAVSEKAAREMAKGATIASGCNVSVSVTGYAGPKADDGREVGLVYICCYHMGEYEIREFHFGGDRMKIREQSVSAALVLLRDCLLKSYKNGKLI